MKKWYKSKTLWANILTVVNAFANGILRIWFTDTAIGTPTTTTVSDPTAGVPGS
jgi:hypothetical protein